MIALVATVALLLAARVAIHWYRNRYRSVALDELREIQLRSQDASSRTEAIAQLAALLKRVALVAWARETVASLSGEPWIEFLNRTGSQQFKLEAAKVLDGLPYRRQTVEQLTSPEIAQLLSAADRWIRTHNATLGRNPEAGDSC